jgi:hypothetical protein
VDILGCTYSGLAKLSVGVEVINAKKAKLHADVDEVAKSDNLDVVGNNAEADHLVAALDTREGNKVTRQEGGGDKRVGSREGTRATEGTVGHGAERVSFVARDAHGEAGEGAD